MSNVTIEEGSLSGVDYTKRCVKTKDGGVVMITKFSDETCARIATANSVPWASFEREDLTSLIDTIHEVIKGIDANSTNS